MSTKKGKKTTGKRFEENFEASCIFYGFCPERLKDGGGWNRGENTSFTISNVCDFIVASENTTFYIENKSFSGTSFPLSNILGQTESQKSKNIKKVKKLVEKDSGYSFVKSFYLILDVKSDIVYCIRAFKILEHIENSTVASLNLKKLEEMSEVVIQGVKIRTNSRYDVREAFRTRNVQELQILSGN